MLRTTGNSEYRLTRYLTVRLNEINGSDTIVKTVSNERVFDLPGTGGLTSTLPFAVNGGIGEFALTFQMRISTQDCTKLPLLHTTEVRLLPLFLMIR